MLDDAVQIFNQFNARKIHDEYNVFAGLLKSQMFIYVAVIITGFQVRYLHSHLNSNSRMLKA